MFVFSKGQYNTLKERAYSNDVRMVQAAVDAYYSALDNTRFIGPCVSGRPS